MIVITGASRGIGKFLLEHFAEQGRQVVGIANNTSPSATVAHLFYKLDVRNEEEIRKFAALNEQALKDVILINAAGISYNSFAHKADLDMWKDVIHTNLIGLFTFIRHLLPFMRNDGYGRIINFSSVVAQHGVAGTSAYSASKSALWGMAKTLAAENGSKNITVNNINLGYFNIGMIEQVPEPLLQTIIQDIPAKRLGKPEEILNTVNYIIETEYLNGASIDLNGGLF